MTKLSAILFASLFSAYAWAGSPFLDISATNTFRSADRAIVEAAVVQAEAAGKPVLIDMSGAWCGPCNALDKQLEAMKAEMEPVLSQFVMVKLEEMHLEMIYGFDFLAFDIAWFPSFMIYNPATQRWTALGATTAPTLKQALLDYQANASLGDFYVDRLMNELRAGRPADAGAIIDAFIVASVEFDGPKYLATLKELVTFMDSNPALFNAPVGELRAYLAMAHSRLLERGVATVADVRAADSQAYAGLESDFGMLQNVEFGIPIGRLIRTQGNVAAADQCAALNAKTAELVKGASLDDQRSLQLVRDIQCLMLDIQVGRKTGVEARAYLATLNANEQRAMTENLMKLFASTGTDFDLAIQFATVYKEMYEKAFAKNPEMLARVSKATTERLAAYQANKSHP